MTEIAWTDMRTPALAIVARGDQIQERSPSCFIVNSQSNPTSRYTVQVKANKWACDCAFNTNTGQSCVHILAARYRLGFIGKTEIEDKPKCEKCQSSDVVGNGKRYNKSGVIKRYLCKTCGHQFTGKDGFKRRRSEPEKIALALDLYFRGMSLRQIVEHFSQVYSLKISHQTIYRWIVHYSKLAAEWMDSQNPQVGKDWNMDETVININGNNHYLWNIMDADTRFLMATHVSKGRGYDETRAPMKKVKTVTDVLPATIRTDGMHSYSWAIGKEFGHRGQKAENGRLVFINPHKRVPSIRAAESNNIVERLHGTEKSRTKVMRAFDQVNGASSLMDGWRVHYDMVREHQAIGMTPGEAAGMPKLEGFKWHELLLKATSEKNNN
jgi:transposase-like protein